MNIYDVAEDICEKAPAGETSHDWQLKRGRKPGEQRHECRNCGLSELEVRERMRERDVSAG